MAFAIVTQTSRYLCLSADVKTTAGVVASSLALETDTGNEFIFNGTAWVPYSQPATIVGSLPNTTLMEQKTQADAVAGVLTFSANINAIEIYNTDAVNAGTFNVNGVNITIPASEPFEAIIGGTPSPNITITDATTYIVSRYI